eukprot:403366182
MNINILPNIAYSMCINKEFLDSEKALEQEEKNFQKEFEMMVYPQDQVYKPLGFDQRDEEEEEEEEEDMDMGNSDREFDDYAEELEGSEGDIPPMDAGQ